MQEYKQPGMREGNVDMFCLFLILIHFIVMYD